MIDQQTRETTNIRDASVNTYSIVTMDSNVSIREIKYFVDTKPFEKITQLKTVILIVI